MRTVFLSLLVVLMIGNVCQIIFLDLKTASSFSRSDFYTSNVAPLSSSGLNATAVAADSTTTTTQLSKNAGGKKKETGAVESLALLRNVKEAVVKRATASKMASDEKHGHDETQSDHKRKKAHPTIPVPKLSTSINSTIRIAGLACPGDDPDAVEEVVYWKDIPSDSSYKSPLTVPEQYLTFEPDEAGFNNIRIAMENAVLLAALTGRTLVLPPKGEMTMYANDPSAKRLSLSDFYDFEAIAAEMEGLNVISFETFLETFTLKGKFRSHRTNEVVFPPGNRTNWDGFASRIGPGRVLWDWMRESSADLQWRPNECVAFIPSKRGKIAVQQTLESYISVIDRWSQHGGNPSAGRVTPVDSSKLVRLAEIMGSRRHICFYDEALQDAQVIHLPGEDTTGQRLLAHFYSFLFVEDWRQDLWMKRFVRDHLRYSDKIQCTAARIIQAIRRFARESGDANGSYNAIHVRRGDFESQFNNLFVSAEDIHIQIKGVFKEARTLYIATDEKKLSYFDPLCKHYQCLFLGNFMQELGSLNPHFYGQVDQIVASKSNIFFGAYFSTFSGYINRLRGYHTQKERLPGYKEGIIQSFYYTPESLQHVRRVMRKYTVVKTEIGLFEREFPSGWRDIDFDVDGDGAQGKKSK